MVVQLKYASRVISIEISDAIEVDEFGSKIVANSFSFENFKEIFLDKGGDRLPINSSPLIIINDTYRNTPTEKILTWLDKIDNSLLNRARVLIATGTHPILTDNQIQSILGEWGKQLSLEGRISSHSATDLGSMVSVGQDSFGEEVFINRLVVESDSIIIIGSVEPHYFAGYTGGRKSLFPGLTDLATIERNHNLANSLDAAPLRLEGNPVEEHLKELLFLLNFEKIFTIQVVMDSSNQIRTACMGNIDTAFHEAVGFSNTLFVNRHEKPYDVVIAEVRSPFDQNLYQVQKGLENCQGAIIDGGTAIVVAACEEGVGSDHFFKLAEDWDRENNCSPDGIVHFGSHKLARVNMMSQRITPGLYSELPAATVSSVFYEPINDIERTIKRLFEMGKCNRLAVVYDAGQTVLQTS